MKMEVLSVQSQYQGQFGVIGSTKVKDWTSPLTPPPTTVAATQNSHHNHQQQQQQQQQQYHHQQQQQHSNQANNQQQQRAIEKNSNNLLQQQQQLQQSVDVVDGRTSLTQKHQHYFYNNKEQQQQQQQQYRSGSSSSSNSFNSKHIMEAATTATPTIAGYNNNLLYCGELKPIENEDIDEAALNELSTRLQSELRLAKSRHLACTEVSLPSDLMPRIAAEIIKTSEREPCGVRGGTIFIEFEDEPNNTRRIGSFKMDPSTVSIFELYLTLRQDKSGWTSLLPQFLKNLTRSNTILISPDFTLTKNKLYACE